MNLRTTGWLFALMLSMLWLFGLMLAFKKNPLDKAYVVPSLQAARNVTIDRVVVQRKPAGAEPREFTFLQEDGVWRLKDPDSGQTVRVEDFRITQLVNQIKTARKDEEADVSDNLAAYGLQQPRGTIALHGEAKSTADDAKDEKADQTVIKDKEWTFYIGDDSPDKRYVYVNSSDEPKKVFAVRKSSLDALFFEDPNHLRSKRLFEFTDVTAQSIELKREGQEIELKRSEEGQWRFAKPELGVADFEGPPPPKELPPGAKQPDAGVKGLLNAILNIRVDADSDFVPLHKENLSKYGLIDGKETLRIQVGSPGAKKDTNKETLLIGEQQRGYYFARMAGDEGVFKLPAKQIEPILAALKDPGQLRSREIAPIETKQVDVVMLERSGEEIKLWNPEGKSWQIQVGSGEQKKAADAVIAKLLETLQGKGQIQRFYDEADAKKLEAELGLDKPAAEVKLYTSGLEKPDAKKDAKEDKPKQKETGPSLRKDAKPAVTLKFGKPMAEGVPVLRTMADGLTARFVAPKAVFEAAAPSEGALAFLDPALPSFDVDQVSHVELERAGKKIELVKGTESLANRWIVKQGEDAAAQIPADAVKVEHLLRTLSTMQAKKWVKPLDAKTELKEYGLDQPSPVVKVQVGKRTLNAASAASILGTLGLPWELRGLGSATNLIAHQQGHGGEKIVIQFGKEIADKDHYGKHSGIETLFTVSGDVVRLLRDVDLRDKTMLLAAEPAIAAGLIGAPAAFDWAGVLGVSPIATAQITSLDPATVKELRLAIRTPYELRQFTFARKDKSWIDQSGLMDFTLDSDKVQQFVDTMSHFRADRFITLVGGPKNDWMLGPKDYTAKIDLITDQGQTITVSVGTMLERFGFFGNASHWPEAVFLVDANRVEPLLRGLAWFAKERVASR